MADLEKTSNKPNTEIKKTPSKLKNCLINAVILIVTTVLMLMLGEGFFRWLDGYQFSSLELQPGQITQPVDKTE